MTLEDPSGAALAALGYDASFAHAFAHAFAAARGAFAHDHLLPARVVAHHRSGYAVHDGAVVRTARLTGKWLHEAGDDALARPAVGDWVVVGGGDAGDVALVHALLPRRSALVRRAAGDATVAQVAAANVDVALLVAALPDGVNARRLERLAVVAWEGGAMPLVVLTKRDLCDDASLAEAVARVHDAAPGVDVVSLSAGTGEGIDALVEHLAPGRTAVLLGPSGAGKSTLANHLLGADHLRTASVRETDGKGRHTTTHRELVRLANGALLIDTPGIREIGLWGTGEGVDAAFDDVASLASACRFADCAHETEPGCAVRAAVSSGALDEDRLEAWRTLKRELAWLARRQDQRAMQDERARHKSIEKWYRGHVRRKYE